MKTETSAPNRPPSAASIWRTLAARVADRDGLLTVARVRELAHTTRAKVAPSPTGAIERTAIAAEATARGWGCWRLPDRSNVYAPTFEAAEAIARPLADAIEARREAREEATRAGVTFARPLVEVGATWEAIADALAAARLRDPTGAPWSPWGIRAVCRNHRIRRSPVARPGAVDAIAAHFRAGGGVVGRYLADTGRPLDLELAPPARVALAHAVAARLAEGWRPAQIWRAWVLFRAAVAASPEWWHAEPGRAACVRLGWLVADGRRLLKRFELAGEDPETAPDLATVDADAAVAAKLEETRAAIAAARVDQSAAVAYALPLAEGGADWADLAEAATREVGGPSPGVSWHPFGLAVACYLAGVCRPVAEGIGWAEVVAEVMARDGFVTTRKVRDRAAEVAADHGVQLDTEGIDAPAAIRAAAQVARWAGATGPRNATFYAPTIEAAQLAAARAVDAEAGR